MNTTPQCERLLVGVSGSLNSIHIHQYLLGFRQRFAAQIKVVMTTAATKMVSPHTVELYCDDRVFINTHDQSENVKVPHMQLAKWADTFIVLPSTADILGKGANGIADDLLSTLIVSYRRPIIFAPAMNPDMFASQAVQRNITQLSEDGHYIIDPVVGVSATTGEWDTALTPPPIEDLLRHLRHVHLKTLQSSYWAEATAELPRTPAQQKLLQLLKVEPVTNQA